MLIQFSVKNFKTFKEKAVLSFIASNYDKETREDENIATISDFNLRIVKSAVMYGANASGKSKFIDALMFMKRFVIGSSKEGQKGDPINVQTYKLDTESENEPAEFEVIFIYNNEMFRYGFEVNSQVVVSEWLYHKPKTKEVELFYREEQKFEFHERNFSKGSTLEKEDLIRENALLLSVAAQFNDKNAGKVLDWFKELKIISGIQEEGYKNNAIAKIKDAAYNRKVLDLLKKADLGIENITYKEYYFDFDPADNKKSFEEIFEGFKKNDEEAFSDITTVHKRYGIGRKRVDDVKFSMHFDESSGTQKFFFLTGPVIDTLETGGILVADELDSKLHPNLVSKIVSIFNSKELNPNNAQLIFNTHDTNLLNSRLFRRDQIWFIEKDRYGAAKLYSLADFKSEVRKADNFEDNYIRGKYGAVPLLNDFEDFIYSKMLQPNENEG